MINNTAPMKLSIVIKLKNDAGETKPLKLSIDSLRESLKAIKESDQRELVISCEDYKRTLSIQEVEEVILKVLLYPTMQNVPIPKMLKKVLTYQYDRRSVIYDEPIVGRDAEVQKLRTFLTSSTKSNCVMLGSDGVGKTTIAQDVARQIILDQVEGSLKGCTILRVNVNGIPKKFPQKQLFYNCLERFVEEYKDKVILHFDYLEDLPNYPEMEDFFMEQLVYKNTRIIGEIIPDSVIKEFFSNDMFKFINFLPVSEPEVDEITALVERKVRTIERESEVTISDNMVRFAIMTGFVLANSVLSNPQLTIEVLNFAAMNAKINGEKVVTKRNILSFYNLDFKLMDKTEEREKYIVAYHEMGHYVVSKMVKNVKRSKNAFVSILPIASALGITASYDEVGKQLTLTREFYIDQIACSYGGRTGEYLYTNVYSSGASADIEEASEMAEKLVLSGGLSQSEDVNNKSYMWGGEVKEYLLTDEEKKKLSKEIDEIRAEGFKRAQQICNENADLIAYLVEALVRDGILLGSELDELVAKFQAEQTK